MLLTGIVFFKLYTISISDYAKVMPTLTNQYTRKLDVTERRGFIFDRNGEIIAGFDDVYNCLIDPSKIPQSYEFINLKTAAETESFEKITQKIFEMRDNPNISKEDISGLIIQGRPFVLRINKNISNEYMTSFQTYKRNQVSNAPALHITGYINKEGNGVGGIEETYNDFLKTTASAKIEAVYNSDALQQSFGGSPIRIIDYGYSSKTGVALTLDINLQKKAEEIADKYLSKGAIIIASASTGEILACVSRPVYSLDNISDYIDSENGEFINRAFCAFTPGSVFKTIVAAAALECDKDYYFKEYECTGIIDAGGKDFRCHKRTGHGNMSMCEAYAESCNTYFMSLALDIGYERIYEMAKNFGIGEKNMLDGLSVKTGNIPDKINPPPAFIANTAIGQGELLITPLETARIFCCIANNGILPELSIVKSFVFEDKISSMLNLSPKKALSDDTVKCLLEMTQACVEYGTGSIAAPEYGIAGGKTSSAESGQYTEEKIYNADTGEIATQRIQIVHSWFSGYYPANAVPDYQPYVISVIAEGGVTDNVRSAVIFKEICDYLGMNLR
ncbi:MAG: penicillin-binding transpeptidase domain-containing protein [Oscillospiraceae bacterium]|nr:penicillin-binding transpeptidase domain-containing protein [Oscillospiraceae bacterium]